MHPNNRIQSGFIVLTDGRDTRDAPTYRIAIKPDNIVGITSHCRWGRCSAKIYLTGNETVETIESLDEILQLIEEYNRQHKSNSNYD